MATVETLTAQRDKLIAQIATLQKRVVNGEKAIEYDLTQAKTTLEILDREISKLKTAASGVRPSRLTRITSQKDL